MNRARQDAITTEIMEIVGGAEALRRSADSEQQSPSVDRDPFERDNQEHRAHDHHLHRTDYDRPPNLQDGRVVAIAGPVVDVEFPPHALPEINNAVEVDIDLDGDDGHRHRRGRPADRRQPGPLRLHEADRRPACAAPSCATWAAASPCPSATPSLGHVFNVLGEPLDTDDIGRRSRTGGRSTATPRPSTQLEPTPPDVRDRHQGHRPARPPTCRAARSACSAAPAWARPCSSWR